MQQAYRHRLGTRITYAADEPLGRYLLGLGVTQFAIALAAGLVCTMLWKVSHAGAIQPRLAGAMVAGAGLFLTLEHFEGPLLQAISS